MRWWYKNISPINRTALMLCGVVLIMGALAWASVPFYNWFCRVTGFGGVPMRAEVGVGKILEQTIKIRFDASTASNMPWEFKPKEREIKVRIGETILAFYEAYNPTEQTITGRATFNVTPYDAGGYFTKIDCFCFEKQTLGPGERVDMPVTFFIDPEILNDPRLKIAPRITLSYTFYKTKLNVDARKFKTTTTPSVN